MNIDDERWARLEGGYRVPYDPRPALARLESDPQAADAWTELWQELFHQGDVGAASYAAVPELVRIEASRSSPDWNTYALVASIELARDSQPSNPAIPAWLQPEYTDSLDTLAGVALSRLPLAGGAEAVRSMLAILAISKQARVHARVLIEFSEDEVLDLLDEA